MSDRTFLDRTLRRLHRLATGRGKGLSETLSPGLSDDDRVQVEAAIRECLEARGGAVSALARAAELSEAYLRLDEEGRGRFMALLGDAFSIDTARLDNAARLQLQGAPGAQAALREALESPRVALFRQLGGLPDGVKFLVDLRAELRGLPLDDGVRKTVDDELKDLLASWFDVGFLELRRVTWDSSADLLERLIAYEAVHEIRSWSDLKNRLDSDRRCFAFFHPRMPDEPLIFVEVALTTGLAGDMAALLDEAPPPLDPAAADAAIFYSISNAQQGLAGISFGNFLIKRVVDLLRAEFPGLRTFATLSPIPGMRRWLEKSDGDAPDDDQALLTAAAHYLLREKRRGRAADPVAHFHLTNGARVERLAPGADVSAAGLHRSLGMMVNYLYKLDEIDANHEAYVGSGTIAASSQVRSLLKGKE
jgi:malonyl-CoA decarboxylase